MVPSVLVVVVPSLFGLVLISLFDAVVLSIGMVSFNSIVPSIGIVPSVGAVGAVVMTVMTAMMGVAACNMSDCMPEVTVMAAATAAAG